VGRIPIASNHDRYAFKKTAPVRARFKNQLEENENVGLTLALYKENSHKHCLSLPRTARGGHDGGRRE
jgi:hypothetical protein